MGRKNKLEKRQILALLVLLGLFVSACGKPYRPSSTDPMSGYEAPPEYRENRTQDPTYKPNPEYDNFDVETQRRNSPSNEPRPQRPVEIPIYEQSEGEAPFTPAPPDQLNHPPAETPIPEPKTAEPIDPSKFAPPPAETPAPAVRPPTVTPPAITPPAATPPTSPPTSKPNPRTPPPVVKIPAPPVATPPSITAPKLNPKLPAERPPGTNTNSRYAETLDLPATAKVQAVGEYFQGSLKNAVNLEEEKKISDEGSCFFLSPNFKSVHYTTDNMKKVLDYTCFKIAEKFKQTFIVNTLSQRGGGPIINQRTNKPAHSSHQNGLDGDITLLRFNDQIPGNLVSGNRVSPNFDVAKNYQLIQILVSTNEIFKILVNIEIKRELCEYSRRLGLPRDPLQTKIVVEDEHYNHMHIRLRCPKGSENLGRDKCEPQLDFLKTTNCADYPYNVRRTLLKIF